MKSMGIDKVANSPFPAPPKVLLLLKQSADRHPRKAMALYPMNPRHSRMLLTDTVIQIIKKDKSYKRPNLVLGYIAAAAALSLSF